MKDPPSSLKGLRMGKQIMKQIHPQYYPQAKVKCACGNVFTLGSTKPELSVEICNKCHPYYTGKEQLIDIAGRVERFKARTAKKITTPKVKKPRTKKSSK